MALALTDRQMCLLLVRGSGLSVAKQRQLLRELRRQAQIEFDAKHAHDPPSPQLSYYHRKRKGLVTIKFTVDPDDAATFLRQSGIPVYAETGAGLSEGFANLVARTLYFGRYGGGE